MLLTLMLGGRQKRGTTDLRVEANEALSTLREVVLMPRDLAPVLPQTDHQDDVVVLVHGFFASAGVFRPLRHKLERELGAKVASFTHPPGAGVRTIARSLAKLVDRIPENTRIHIVGHSLGGVVARWYVQELGGYARVTQTFSLGSPFRGTRVAHPFPFLVGADLHTKSRLLQRLRDRAHEVRVPHTSILGDADRLIVPQDSAILPSGDVALFTGLGHNALLYDKRVQALIAARVKTVRPLA